MKPHEEVSNIVESQAAVHKCLENSCFEKFTLKLIFKKLNPCILLNLRTEFKHFKRISSTIALKGSTLVTFMFN